MAKIIIYVPDEAPVKYGLEEEDTITVGRSSENDIVIEHDSISSQHAKFEKSDGQYHLVDLDSTNGTFVDGVEAANTPLNNGMRIIFGTVDVDYQCDEFASEEKPEAEAEGTFESSGSVESSIHATVGDSSIRPAGFKNLSPVEVVEKKDTISQIAMIMGVVAIVAAAALIVVSMTLKV